MGEPSTKRAKTGDAEMDKLCINSIRMLSADQVQAANSGHPGAPMGMAPMAYALFTRAMRYNPSNPKWINRDRFVLSNGHSCALQYSMLHLTGYARPSLQDLKDFRQYNSVTAGHPENELLEAVEVSTGPLGSGISNAVGLAIGAAHMAARFNTAEHAIFDNFTYVFCGDGCMQEGVASEACSLAGHLKLGRLIVLYDDNKITIDGDTALAFSEDVGKRFEAYGWQVLSVDNGDDTDISNITSAIQQAKGNEEQPTLIRVRTTIGFGAKKQGTGGVHGAPLGAEEIARIKKEFGLDPAKSFEVPDAAMEHLLQQKAVGEAAEKEWQQVYDAWKAANADRAAELERRFAGELPEGCFDKFPTWAPGDKALATRASSGKVLNAVAEALPELVGGSADLMGSNCTQLDCTTAFQANDRAGRYLHFGVREHAMAAVCNGLAAYGGFVPFGATFLVFAGYAFGSMRLSALSGFRVLYIMTHDSIGLGEDGPTHQAIGTLAALRAVPNMFVFRPADATEVAGSYKAALAQKHSPSTLALSRQNLPNLEGSDADKVLKGGYTLRAAQGGAPKLVIAATGSEVHVAVAAAEKLESEQQLPTSVVSLPCFELFDKQPLEYRKEVFPEGVPVLSLEAASTLGWSKYAHHAHGIDVFGMSAPAPALFEHFGFTQDKVAALGGKVAAKYAGGKAPSLVDMAEPL